jgi:hypothetical protein
MGEAFFKGPCMRCGHDATAHDGHTFSPGQPVPTHCACCYDCPAFVDRRGLMVKPEPAPRRLH